MFKFFCAAILLSMGAQAAIPSQIKSTAPEAISAKELLSLPEQNRIMVLKSHSNPQLIDQLLNLAFDEKEEFQTRWKALTFSGELGGKSVVAEIDRACEAKEWFMKNACLVSLESIDQSKAFKRARGMLTDKALVVRTAAVEVLAKSKASDVRSVLWKEFSEKRNFRNGQSLWIRPEIVKLMAADPDPLEKAEFVQALRDKDQRMHLAAISALEHMTHKTLGSKTAKLEEKRALWLAEAGAPSTIK